jgi:hypothetical protein
VRKKFKKEKDEFNLERKRETLIVFSKKPSTILEMKSFIGII